MPRRPAISEASSAIHIGHRGQLSSRAFWQIDLDADSPREAAERAATIVRRLDTEDECSATVFDVYERRAGVVRRTGRRVDLSNESENRPIRFRADTLP